HLRSRRLAARRDGSGTERRRADPPPRKGRLDRRPLLERRRPPRHRRRLQSRRHRSRARPARASNHEHPGRSIMIDHTGITVADFAASKAFYDKAMAPLGASLLMTVPKEFTGGVNVAGYGRDRPVFWVADGRKPLDHQHIAFTARNRAEVDAFHAAAI